MTWYAVFESATGRLVSVGDVLGDIPQGFESVSVGETRPDGVWNTETHQFDAPATVEAATAWYIDVGPFFDRFGAKALSVVSSSDAQVQGLVTLALARKWIDLKRADLAQFLGLLVLKGLLDSADVTRILTTPVVHEEQRALLHSYFGRD